MSQVSECGEANMQKIVIGICDDENFWIEKIGKDVLAYSNNNCMDIELKTYQSAEDYLKKEETVDILLLDIEMKEISGIELKDLLAKRMENEAIIFISGYNALVWEAFGKNVYGFLDKPIVKEKLYSIINRIMDEKVNIIDVLVNNDKYILSSKIIYVKSIDKYIKIYTKQEEYIGYFSLKECEQKLQAYGFKRVHKSYIVNFEHIVKIENVIKMDNGFQIRVGRGKVKEIKSEFLEYVRKRARA